MNLLRKLVILGLLALVPVSAGWTGDSLIDLLKSAFKSPPWEDATQNLIIIFSGLLVFCLAVYGLHKHRLRLGVNSRADITRSVGEYPGRPVLIMGLSALSDKSPPLADMGNKPLESLTGLEEKPPHPWRQNYRVIGCHLGATDPSRRLRKIVLITSTASNKDFDSFEAMLRRHLEDARSRDVISEVPAIVRATPDGINFEQYTDIFGAVSRAVDDAGATHDDICVDVSSG
ncbi:MAG TPA: hypothetical protein VEB64_17800, partial [Azospirillaceae bacterium]|nr:hypothetical protein [Azospirillaceae bacterium]